MRTCARQLSTYGTKGKNSNRDMSYMKCTRIATCGVDRSYLRDAACFVAIEVAPVIAIACGCTRKSEAGYERRCLLDAATICLLHSRKPLHVNNTSPKHAGSMPPPAPPPTRHLGVKQRKQTKLNKWRTVCGGANVSILASRRE